MNTTAKPTTSARPAARPRSKKTRRSTRAPNKAARNVTDTTTKKIPRYPPVKTLRVALARLWPYQSTHWITGLDEGPDGEPWYRFTDELQPVDYHALAMHFRPILDEELAPISPNLPFEAKRIEVSLRAQTLTAYENDQAVYFAKISTGIPDPHPSPNGIPTATPTGQFNVFSKMPSKHMGNARLTDNLDDYILMGVPWTCFFVETGVALHGTYWHNNYGWPMSRGCVNLRSEDAKWLFRWVTPVSLPTDWEKRGYGTQIVVF